MNTGKRRALLERLVWKHTHNDFKSKRSDGTKVVNQYVAGRGTCSVPLSCLTDAELIDKIPKKIRDAEGIS